MAYSSNVHGQTYRVEINDAEQELQVLLDDRAYTLDWQKIAGLATAAQGGHYSILIAGHSYDLFVRNITRAKGKGTQTYEIQLGGQRFEVKVEDERTSLLNKLAGAGSDSSMAEVEAPMPGLVIGVPYEVGAHIESGQTVVVLEAMKMENDLTAPISGTLKELRVSKGQTVDQGEILAVIATEESA